MWNILFTVKNFRNSDIMGKTGLLVSTLSKEVLTTYLELTKKENETLTFSFSQGVKNKYQYNWQPWRYYTVTFWVDVCVVTLSLKDHLYWHSLYTRHWISTKHGWVFIHPVHLKKHCILTRVYCRIKEYRHFYTPDCFWFFVNNKVLNVVINDACCFFSP